MYLFKHQGCPEQREMGNVLHVKSLIITDWDEHIWNQINDEIMKNGFSCSDIRSAFDALPKKPTPESTTNWLNLRAIFPTPAFLPFVPQGAVCVYVHGCKRSYYGRS